MLRKIKYHLIYALISVLGLAGIIIFYFLLMSSSRTVLQNEDRDKAYRTAMELEYIYFNNVSNSLYSMSTLDQLKEALEHKDINLLQDLLMVLKYSFPYSVVYIMDRDGTVVQGTAYNKKGDTFVGNNYSFRPYFYNTKYGESVIYPATGVTSGARGLYFSRGIFNNGEFLGTLVVKFGMDGIDKFLNAEDDLHLSVMSPEGVIFASSEESLIYKSLMPLTDFVKKKINDNQQFGNHELKVLGDFSGSDSLLINDSRYHCGTIDFHKTEWTLLYTKLFSAYRMRPEDRILLRIIIFSFIPLMIILFFLVRLLILKQEAEASLKLYNFMVEQSPVSFVVTDLNGAIEYTNPFFSEFTGFDGEKLIGENPRILKSGVHDRDFYENMWNTVMNGNAWNGEICNKSRDGNLFWEDASIYPLKDARGNIYKLIGVKTDISSRKEMIDRLEYYASVDEMTSVMNRRTGMLVLEKQMSLSQRTGRAFSLCYADVNDLKHVNDTLGHGEGDKLIQSGTDILKDAIRSSDSICRVGGDEFMMILSDSDMEMSGKIVQRIQKNIEEFNRNGNEAFTLSISLGVVQFDQESHRSAEELVKAADKVMYLEKQKYKKLRQELKTG